MFCDINLFPSSDFAHSLAFDFCCSKLSFKESEEEEVDDEEEAEEAELEEEEEEEEEKEEEERAFMLLE